MCSDNHKNPVVNCSFFDAMHSRICQLEEVTCLSCSMSIISSFFFAWGKSCLFKSIKKGFPTRSLLLNNACSSFLANSMRSKSAESIFW